MLAQAIAEDVLPPGLEQERMLQVHARHAYNLACGSPKRDGISGHEYKLLYEVWVWAVFRYFELEGKWLLRSDGGYGKQWW